MLKKTSNVLLSALAAAALAMSAGAYAASTSDAATSTTQPTAHGPMGGPGGPGGWHGHRGPRGPRPGGFEHMLEHLHAELKLTPAQEQAWQQARAATRQNFEAMRANHQAARQQFKTAMQQPILDLAAMHNARDQIEQRDQSLRSSTDQQWITVYNMLSDAQKTMVSNEIKGRWQKMMAKHRRHGRHGQPPHDGASPPAAGDDTPPAAK